MDNNEKEILDKLEKTLNLRAIETNTGYTIIIPDSDLFPKALGVLDNLTPDILSYPLNDTQVENSQSIISTNTYMINDSSKAVVSSINLVTGYSKIEIV